MNEVDLEKLLLKYIAYVAMEEGIDFAESVDLGATMDMGDMEFSREEIEALQKNFFPKIKKWYCGI